jgi:hypothetical protein
MDHCFRRATIVLRRFAAPSCWGSLSTLWTILCVALQWSIAQPSLNPLAVTHPRTVGISALAMLCGTRAHGAPSRAWDIAFLVLAILPAALFGVHNFLLDRKLASPSSARLSFWLSPLTGFGGRTHGPSSTARFGTARSSSSSTPPYWWACWPYRRSVSAKTSSAHEHLGSHKRRLLFLQKPNSLLQANVEFAPENEENVDRVRSSTLPPALPPSGYADTVGCTGKITLKSLRCRPVGTARYLGSVAANLVQQSLQN